MILWSIMNNMSSRGAFGRQSDLFNGSFDQEVASVVPLSRRQVHYEIVCLHERP